VPGLVPDIHVFFAAHKAWMGGTTAARASKLLVCAATDFIEKFEFFLSKMEVS
jgi:hypothetical protein